MKVQEKSIISRNYSRLKHFKDEHELKGHRAWLDTWSHGICKDWFDVSEQVKGTRWILLVEIPYSEILGEVH